MLLAILSLLPALRALAGPKTTFNDTGDLVTRRSYDSRTLRNDETLEEETEVPDSPNIKDRSVPWDNMSRKKKPYAKQRTKHYKGWPEERVEK
jgi:hypothetical protein